MVYLQGKIAKMGRGGFVVAVDNGDDKKPARVWVVGDLSWMEVGDPVVVKCTLTWRKVETGEFRLLFTLVEIRRGGGR